MNYLKFRMWNNVSYNPTLSKMFYETEEVITCLKQQILYNEDNKSKLGYDHISDGCAFLQNTGLLDKNSVEIYEGDIIRCEYLDDNGFLAHSDMQIFRNVINASFCYDDSYRSDKSSFQELNQEFCSDLLVVGNIYTNPELLTPSDK